MKVEGARLAQEQLDLARRFVAGDLQVPDFIEQLLRARNARIDAGSCDDLVLLDLLDDIWFAIDMHNAFDDLREPDEFDDEQLHDVLTRYLADWDAGTWQFDPRWARE
jgi:hypothetical protein